jgi:hypothetical protein
MTLEETIILGIFLFVIVATCKAAYDAAKYLFKEEE